jgi:hypothetical protein
LAKRKRICPSQEPNRGIFDKFKAYTLTEWVLSDTFWGKRASPSIDSKGRNVSCSSHSSCYWCPPISQTQSAWTYWGNGKSGWSFKPILNFTRLCY